MQMCQKNRKSAAVNCVSAGENSLREATTEASATATGSSSCSGRLPISGPKGAATSEKTRFHRKKKDKV